MGTENSKGSKVFALAGKIQRGGLAEVPMGITINEIVYEIGGGIKGDKKFKAVQMGGPSGGCIPASMGDLRIDYQQINKTGAIMGSGGLVVMDETTCMVDMAKFFLRFTQDESCGKCTFCRIGTKRMLEILERITDGKGEEGDVALLQHLAYQIKNNTICGLGQTAPNPVLTTLKYFPEEYEAHIRHKKCPAHSCPGAPHLYDTGRRVQGLHGLRQGMSGGGHQRGKEEGPYDRSGALHQVRQVFRNLQVQRSAQRLRWRSTMTEQLKIKINDREYAANPGDTILDVVRRHEIDTIPTLCHDPKLPPYGSCYLCVVEVEGLEKLVPSCSSPVAPGMAIHTNNERIRESRKTALELLLSNHYADCLGPCTQTCPAGVDVQGYIALMSMGRHREAVRLIKEKNPLPLVCGRVCVRECETACRRNLVDDRVGIDYLKRYAADIDIENPWVPDLPIRETARKVAVVGGGPAGLTCAYFLDPQRLQGDHLRELAEAGRHAALRHPRIPAPQGPPRPGDQMDHRPGGGGQDRDEMWARTFSLQSPERDAGSMRSFSPWARKKQRPWASTGEEQTGRASSAASISSAGCRPTSRPRLHGTVVVVGGGNTAVDAARTALRIGAEKVVILYRRTMKEMPAHQMEIDAAAEEGVEMIFLSAPLSIVAKDGRIEALRCIRMELGEPDASPAAGARCLSKGPSTTCRAISSSLQSGRISTSPRSIVESGLTTTRQKAIVVDKGSFATSMPGRLCGRRRGDRARGGHRCHRPRPGRGPGHRPVHKDRRDGTCGRGLPKPQGGLRRDPGK